MEAAVATDAGRVRPGNEDSVLADPEAGILIVADGMGGHRAGEVASDLAVKTIHGILKRAGPNFAAMDTDARSVLSQAVSEANQVIWLRAAQDPALRGMGTTVAMAVVLGPRVWLAHAGDSRIYLVRGGKLVRLTQDHSLVAQMVRAGEITPEEARRHPLRNVISRCLGTEATVQVEIQLTEWEPGDILALCSDGLTGMLEDDEMAQILNSGSEDLEQICRDLIAAANDHGGKDNISVILARQ
jgi:serine/threonine protein phosphatase PrpC